MQTQKIIQTALEEDIGTGDITTLSCVSAGTQINGRFVAKEDLILCGCKLLVEVFRLLNPMVSVVLHKQDGDAVAQGDVIATICGNARAILTGERTALNFLQHLSGVATITRAAVDAVAGTNAKICDTRKTTPGLRVLEKQAVRVGGGVNHRLGLSDGVLIKDNHIAAAGGIAAAVQAARENVPHTLKIEVETTTLAEVDEALATGAEIIMLDNMPLTVMREAVIKIDRRALTEASGNMGDRDAEGLRAVAETGVDLISIGGLTHSVKAADISLKFGNGVL